MRVVCGLTFVCSFFFYANVLLAASLPKLKVSENKRFLVEENGKPFFYLGDTAWELFHRLDRKQAIEYLQKRADQKYTVIQAVALAELNGIEDPNSYGDVPLINKDPAKPAITAGKNPNSQEQYDYWDHVDFIIDEAEKRGLYIAMLPTWGGWVIKARPTDKEPIFTASSAQAYGEFLGKRYGKRSAVIWILGGDRVADGVEPVWRSMVKGIAIGLSGREDYSQLLMSFHPRGQGKSSKWFHNDEWLDFNMQQNGHGLADTHKPWEHIAMDYKLEPAKPTMDGEPLYEDHPLAFKAKVNGYSFDAHVRLYAYWDMFAGALGHTYGNHAVWQMFAPGRKPINGPLMYWYEAIHRPGAAQMQYVRALIESRPFLSRVPDQSIVENALDGFDRIQATRGDGYAFIYSGQGRPFTVNMGKISGEKVIAYWYNPRNGSATSIGTFDNKGKQEFTAPSEGFGSDWVLILDDVSKKFPLPGTAVSSKNR
jgi:hypothetical protein